MIVKLYQLYSGKSIKKNIFLKYACILSVILAVSIMFSMQIILNLYEKNISDSIRAMNGSNIKILDSEYLEHNFSEEQLESLNKIVGGYDYTLAYCSNTNLVADETDDLVSMTVLNNDNIISSFGINSLNSGEVVISDIIAKRLDIHIGDYIYIKLHSSNYEDSRFQVVQILNDNACFSVAGSEYEIAQETLGRIYIVLPEFGLYNTAYIECTDIGVISTLKNEFFPLFSVRTFDELSGIVQPRIKLQVNILKLISSIAMIISSICLVWSFLIFIMDRKNDFLIFKKIGIQTRDLSKLLLLEIYSVVVKGIIIGIPVGGVFAAVYLQKSIGIEGVSVFLVLRGIAFTILLALLETAAFSLVPISRIKKIVDPSKTDDSKIPIWIITVTIIIMMISSCIYVLSLIGIIFFLLIGLAFIIFYLVLKGLAKLLVKIFLHIKNINFLFINDIRREISITSFSLNIIDFCLVVLFVLISILPMLYSSMEAGTNSESENISYSTIRQTSQEEILINNNIDYYKYYSGKIELLQVNGIDIDNYINESISEKYKEDSAEVLKNRIIHIYAGTSYKVCSYDMTGAYINNIYKNIINFKEGDLLTFSLDNNIVSCRIAGVYEDSSNKDIIGSVPEIYLKSEKVYIENTEVPIVYMILENIDSNILSEILVKDQNAYIDKNQQLSEYLKKYINDQKAVFVNNIIAVGFSSVLLVLLGQIILFVRKKDYYVSLWKIGMSRKYLIKSLLIEKLFWSILQVFVISLFLEPIRFLILAEVSVKAYSLSISQLLAEFVIVMCINVASIFFPIIMNGRKIRKYRY
ncbi:MAG: hypothetical protein MR549_02875 [Lachnobacterium sp.]|nr:hypothetical protein [Lachnobacterium sp.]